MTRMNATWLLTPLLIAVLGCQTQKSSNPLSPSVAGPIPGVSISAPQPVDPGLGQRVEVAEQPLTLTVNNASTTGVRPLSYSFQLAADAGFTNVLFARDGITPGSGKTSLRLADNLATDRTYYWRARAQDGANTGPFTDAVSFSVYTKVVLTAPGPVSPLGGTVLTGLTPTFVFNNAGRTGPAGAITYNLQLALNDSFSAMVFEWDLREQPNQTSFAPGALQYATTYFWRVRAIDPSGVVSVWSPTQFFATPAVPVVVIPPDSGGGGGDEDGDGGGDWENCPTAHDQVSGCVINAINPPHTVEGAFEVTKRVAWLLRGEGAGLLIKNGGENIVSWRGYSFAAARVCYPDGHIYKILTDVPTTNGPGWSDNGYVDPSLYVRAIDPR